jgi:hypothetical protein
VHPTVFEKTQSKILITNNVYNSCQPGDNCWCSVSGSGDSSSSRWGRRGGFLPRFIPRLPYDHRDLQRSTSFYHLHRDGKVINKYMRLRNISHFSLLLCMKGAAMMDFFVRELRAVVPGPMAIIRLGTCGGLSSDTPAGSVVIASGGSAFISRRWDDFPIEGNNSLGYNIHKVHVHTLCDVAIG